MNKTIKQQYDVVVAGGGSNSLSAAAYLAKAGMAESPADQNEWSPSFAGGDFMGIGMFQHQLLGRRPTPRLAQYAVPGADGLYLTGPFMHPGGAVTGGGRATAMKIMEDLMMDCSKYMSI